MVDKRKRGLIRWGGGLSMLLSCNNMLKAQSLTDFQQVDRNRDLTFPRDYGAHFGFGIEWWYVTGWLWKKGGALCAFQITFFRRRSAGVINSESSFSPEQLIFGHASLILPKEKELFFAERAGRIRKGIIDLSEVNTNIVFEDWFLKRDPLVDKYIIAIKDAQFNDDLTLSTISKQKMKTTILRGDNGFSRKGPSPKQASFYYSRPNLVVDGSVRVKDQVWLGKGLAWLDHEWSSKLLARQAIGWDWIGINLLDGGSLMAFRIRERDGKTFWSDFSLLDSFGNNHPKYRSQERVVEKHSAKWIQKRFWKSSKSRAEYPIEQNIIMGEHMFMVRPIMDNQEIDARLSTGTFYYEGAVKLYYGKRLIGRGFLELTGYSSPLRLQ